MGWEVVALVAIVIWGGVKAIQAKHGIVSDEDGNETRIAGNETREDLASQAEVKALKERVAVLERLVTDPSNNLAHEIESLRDTRQAGSGIPLDIKSQEKA